MDETEKRENMKLISSNNLHGSLHARSRSREKPSWQVNETAADFKALERLKQYGINVKTICSDDFIEKHFGKMTKGANSSVQKRLLDIILYSNEVYHRSVAVETILLKKDTAKYKEAKSNFEGLTFSDFTKLSEIENLLHRLLKEYEIMLGNKVKTNKEVAPEEIEEIRIQLYATRFTYLLVRNKLMPKNIRNELMFILKLNKKHLAMWETIERQQMLDNNLLLTKWTIFNSNIKKSVGEIVQEQYGRNIEEFIQMPNHTQQLLFQGQLNIEKMHSVQVKHNISIHFTDNIFLRFNNGFSLKTFLYSMKNRNRKHSSMNGCDVI
jgi:hypothetical protein